jgi:protein-tyrosine phosphatase
VDEERWLDIDGAYNVRDLGGYETVDGRRTRWRKFLRTDNLHKLTDLAQSDLVNYGLGTVIDLRRTRETIETPNVFAQSPNVEYIHANMIGDTDPPDYGTLPVDGVKSPAWVSRSYQILLDARQDAIREILGTLSRSDGHTAIFHCAGGTDRTGIIAALLLGLAGVPHDTIAEDYALSAEGIRARFLAEGIPEMFTEITPDDLTSERAQHTLAPPHAMRITLQYLDDKYGGIESYVRKIGLSDARIDNIRSALLE